MKVQWFKNVNDFYSIVKPYFNPLLHDDVLFYGVLLGEIESRATLTDRLFSCCFDEEDEKVCAAAFLTPPFTACLLSHMSSDAAFHLGAEWGKMWLEKESPELDGVQAPGDTGPSFLSGFQASNPCLTKRDLRMQLSLYNLPRSFGLELKIAKWAEQRSRQADLSDLPHYQKLCEAFAHELGLTHDPRLAEGSVSAGHVFLLDNDDVVDVDDGPACCVRITGHTGNSARVGAVYTKPHARQKGLASQLVRLACKRSFEQDSTLHSLYLFADNDNPHSTGMYKKIGFVPCGSNQLWKFELKN